MEDAEHLMLMRIEKKRALTPHITEFTLQPTEDELPSFTAGAHITLETPSGAMRRYSLINDGEAPSEYVIAVKREIESRGGSASMHDDANEGDILQVEEPENDFPLVDAPEYLLIAGGIGITPIYAMAQHLERAGKPFSVVYCTRTSEDTAYLDEMTEAFGNKVIFHHDDGDPEQIYDFWDLFEQPSRAHVYCCGPKPLMEEIEGVSGHWPGRQIHFEDFKPVEAVRAEDGPFDVTVANFDQTIHVPGDRTILEALRDAGLHKASSCESGTCGTCRSKLIEGEVDHRDMVLTEEQRRDHIMICISRAQSDHLVIEI